jgi:hypothetical protein
MVLGRQKIQISPGTLERIMANIPGKITLSAVCEALERITFIIYCADEDNAKWARPESEFVDGRFEEIERPVTPVPMPSDRT